MRLVIIGNIDSQVTSASKIASDHGAKVTHCPNIESAIASISSGSGAELIMIDVLLDVKKLIDTLNNEHIHVPVVGYGINADSQAAVRAIKAGAKEYIPLPPDEKLIAAVLEAIVEENNSIIYSSNEMKNMIALADKIAPSNANILITGESGTGKEVVAKYIHRKSKRSKGNFISVNCAAIPDNLLESELFGHEKGAFTGATHRRIGKFEESNNGTLLLDEISEMDLRLQAKLLRAIQEKEIDRVGGTKPIRLNLRVLATSNRNLVEEVKKGTFREDLFFRLNVIELKLPPLRNRKDDIGLFTKYFAKKYAEANGLAIPEITDEALVVMKANNWSGNVRELENTIHRAVLLSSGGKIDVSSLMIDNVEAILGNNESINSGQQAGIGDFVGRTVGSVEQDLIIGTVDHCLGNRTQAANILGISIRTLRNKLKQYEEAGG